MSWHRHYRLVGTRHGIRDAIRFVEVGNEDDLLREQDDLLAHPRVWKVTARKVSEAVYVAETRAD